MRLPPYKIKMVEPIKLIARDERERAMKEAHYNTFLLKSEDVYIDLLTDSGTSAMSDNQWAGIMLGDEAYAGSKNFYNLEKAIQDVYGFPYIVPTHQGRGAEHIQSQLMIKAGDVIPNNLYFTTRRAHQEIAHGIWKDVSIDEAHDPENNYEFKGNMNLDKLEECLINHPVPFVSLEACVNMAGGEPFSMINLREVKELCKKYKKPLWIDATRLVENAYFIQQREWKKPINIIVRKICSYADGITVSAKKDCLVNMGGFIALRDEELFERMRGMVVIYEGLHTYGGLSGRDMEALARGIREMIDDNYIAHRVGQVECFGKRLQDGGVPIVVPIGGHAVFLDAKRFIPHIPQHQYPAQTLSAEIYEQSGVRTMERGIVSGQHGDEPYDGLELVRLTIPRRVYTTEHLDYAADSMIHLYNKSKTIKGLTMTYEPKELRFFQARFKKL